MTHIETFPLATPQEIAQAWQEIQAAFPNIRIREAAQKLQLSEAQLLATQVGEEVIRLKPEWSTLLKRLPELGRIMSLTRNDACVLEHKGAFEKVSVFGGENHRMATVIGPIETRVFLNSWHVAFATEQRKDDRTLTSLQVFDHAGHAVTKIYLQPESHYEAFKQLVNDLRADDQTPVQAVETYPEKVFSEEINAQAFLADWAGLQDTHDFFPLLRKHDVHRHRAMQLAEGTFTKPFAPKAVETLLERAAADKLPIMIFAGNRGNLQIHQDTVRTIRLLEREGAVWLNVLDPDFNMHLRLDLLTEAWVVSKPTTDGVVTSIECYSAEKELVVQFFGLRKPGQPELTAWKALVEQCSHV